MMFYPRLYSDRFGIKEFGCCYYKRINAKASSQRMFILSIIFIAEEF